MQAMSNEQIRETTREELFFIQLASLAKLLPHQNYSFLHRVASRLHEDFIGKPLSAKVRFLKFATLWAISRATAKLRHPRVYPVSAAATGDGLRVAVLGTGALGDFTTHLLFIQELQRQYGPLQVDFYARPTKIHDAECLFANVPFIRNIIDARFLPKLKCNYDLVVQIRHVVRYEIINHARILQHDPHLLNVIAGANDRFQPYTLYFDSHPFLDGVLARHFAIDGKNLADAVAYTSNLNFPRETYPFYCPNLADYDVLARLGLVNKKYLTIHDGYDVSFVSSSGAATKTWPLRYWNELVSLIKKEWRDILIVQLGSINSRKIDGVDLDLRRKTTIDEAAWILKHSMLHVDGESGLVRLAHAVHTTSTVLFGPTSKSFFAFDDNINLTSEVCGECWWTTQNWLSSCPRGLSTPECMETIEPKTVYQAVHGFLTRIDSTAFQLESASLYGDEPPSESDRAELRNIFRAAELEPVAISGHAKNANSGVYLHASKQWEYVQAVHAIKKLELKLKRKLRIADVGGGRGALAIYLGAMGHHVEVFDIDYFWDHGGDRFIERRFQRWAKQLGVEIKYGSLFNVPAKSGDYDVVLSMSVLEHVPHKAYAIREAMRLLRNGGRFCMSFDFSLDPAKQEDNLRVEVFTPERLAQALEAIGLAEHVFSTGQTQKSIEKIQDDRVAGIPVGMTVGHIVVSKAG